ncbi:hypothetical protein [Bifidobacterium rousetti]|nr:hypothetical protein [Bifidobacterium rousetti]
MGIPGRSAEQPVQPMRRDAWWVWPATAGVILTVDLALKTYR